MENAFDSRGEARLSRLRCDYFTQTPDVGALP